MILTRDEVVGLAFTVTDILVELRAIRALLEGEDGEEVQEDLE